MTVAMLPIAIGEALLAARRIATLAGIAREIAAKMQIPRALGSTRRDRERMRALASTCESLAGNLAGTLGEQLAVITVEASHGDNT